MKFIAGLILGLLIVPFGAYLYFTGGSAPVATTDSDMPFEKYFAQQGAERAHRIKTCRRTCRSSRPRRTIWLALNFTSSIARVCHGLPLTPKTAIATGMYPQPPLLLEGKGVTDDEPGESYWKIFNGFRLTGMPGFSKSLSETQMWQMALLLANADKLPASAKAALVAPAPSAPYANVPPATTPPAPMPNSAPPPK